MPKRQHPRTAIINPIVVFLTTVALGAQVGWRHSNIWAVVGFIVLGLVAAVLVHFSLRAKQ